MPRRLNDSPNPSSYETLLLDRVDLLAGTGREQLDRRSAKIFWSDNLYRLFGTEPRSWQPTPAAIVKLAHPGDRERLRGRLESLLDDVPVPSLAFRVVHLNGRCRHLRAPASEEMLRDERGSRLTAILRDVDERCRLERELAARQAVSATLAGWTSFEASAPRLLRALGEPLGCAAGVVWIPRHALLNAQVVWVASPEQRTPFETATRTLRLPYGVDLPGVAWQRQRPVDALTLTRDRDDLRRDAATAAGLRTAIAFPIVWRDEVLGVVELRSPELCEIPASTMTAIGQEIGAFLARRRAQLSSPPLTRRELEVLRLASEGLPATQLGARLTITPATVSTHLEHIYAKLGVASRTAAVAHALRSGLIE
jgi:DNA-binding CsgD family transcriptional regulator